MWEVHWVVNFSIRAGFLSANERSPEEKGICGLQRWAWMSLELLTQLQNISNRSPIIVRLSHGHEVEGGLEVGTRMTLWSSKKPGLCDLRTCTSSVICLLCLLACCPSRQFPTKVVGYSTRRPTVFSHLHSNMLGKDPYRLAQSKILSHDG